MGWMPKKLRQSAKIVDCNSPEYQAQEKARKAAEETNERNKGFNDMLTKDLTKWSDKQTNDNKWAEDLPDGSEERAKDKYEVDYSRFDRIDDVQEERVVEERDWYYDSKGQRCQTTSSGAAVGASESTAASKMKKGFLDSVKTPLYKDGSEQRAPPSEQELNAKMAEVLGPDADKELEQLEKLMRGPDQAAGPPPIRREPPSYTLTEGEQLQLNIVVPGLGSMKGVSLDITEFEASLFFPTATGFGPLAVKLPKAVAASECRAKFSKKTQSIVVTLPLAA